MFHWTGVFFVACCLSIGSRTFEARNSEKERLWLDLLNVWRSDGPFNDNQDSSDLFSEEFFDDSGGGRRERFVWEETPSINGTAEDPPKGSSLVFVFDSTGSMKSELLQVKIGAAKILDALRVRPDVPIRNYIMIPFKDPAIGPVTVTADHGVFRESMENITAFGGGDCPEVTVAAVKKALQLSLPNSYIYVFTDASAKDYRLQNEVLSMIQRKKSQIDFIMTDDCGSTTEEGYRVYEKIAETSFGQIYRLNKSEVKEVLKYLKVALQPNVVNLLSQSMPAPENAPDEHEVLIDKTLHEFTISVSGKNPSINLTDPEGKKVDGPPKLTSLLHLDNVKIVSVKEPDPGSWKVLINSESDYRVKTTGLSDVTFRHGFSTTETRNMRETSYRPLKGSTCYLLIKTSDSEKIYNITTVDLVDMKGDVIQRHDLESLPETEGLYTTNAFDPPKEFFYLGILGYGKDGIPIKRITTTAINAQSPEKPIISMQSKTLAPLGMEGKVTCFVESVVPFTVQWYRDGTFTGVERSCSQTCEAVLRIGEVGRESEGQYMCLARNVAGSSRSSTVLVTIARAPKVEVSGGGDAIIGETIYLRCYVSSNVPYHAEWFKSAAPDGSSETLHPVANGELLKDDTLMLPSVHKEDEGWYICSAESSAGSGQDRLFLTVKQPLTVTIDPVITMYAAGDSVTLKCFITGGPTSQLEWTRHRQKIDDDSAMVIGRKNGSLTLTIMPASREHAGSYFCHVKNPREPGILASARAELIYKEVPSVRAVNHSVTAGMGEEVLLMCEITGVPFPTIRWYKNGKELVASSKAKVDELGRLTLAQVTPSDSAEYVCEGSNEAGINADHISLLIGVPPSFLQTPKDKKIEFGQKDTLPCSATGIPEPEISWRRLNGNESIGSGSRVLSSGALTIERMDPKDAGVYECIAENAFGSATMRVSIDVYGLEKPARNDFVRLSEVKGIAGGDLTVPCGIVLGNPVGRVTWFKDGKPVAEEDGKKVDKYGNLVLRNATGADSGRYSCFVYNLAGNSSRSFDVRISESPRISEEFSRDVKARRGGRIIIPCPAEGRPRPSITWSKDGLPIIPTDVIFQDENGSLVIKNLNEENSGTYVCTGHNFVGSTSKSVSLQVQVPPAFTEEALQQSLNIVEGYVVLLNCNAMAVPKATTRWFKNGNGLMTDEGPQEQPESLRFVANVDDAGVYKCVVSNEAGSIFKTFSVTVSVPPSIVDGMNEESIRAKAGERLILECRVRGTPPPTILWQRNGMYLTMNTSEVTLIDPGLLILENVTKESAGAYVCDAENLAGIIQKMYYLQVHYAPEIKEDDVNTSLTLKEGEEFSIPCSAEGNPVPSVVWRKNGFLLRHELADSTIILSDNTLVLLQVSQETSGLYRCEVSNIEGFAFKEHNVSVIRPPSLAPSNYHTTKKVNEGEPVVLTCPISNSNPPPTIMWLKDGKPLNRLLRERADEAKIKLSEDQRELTITEVHPADNGTYSCTATNSAGRADAKFLVDVLMTPHFEEFNHVAHRTILTGGEVALNCSVSGNPQPKVTWRKETLPVTPENTPGVHVSLDKQHLVIQSGKLHHSGTYICTAVNEVSRKEREFYVSVLEPPTILGKDRETLETIVGHSLSLHCPFEGVPRPNVKWFKTGQNKTTISTSAEALHIDKANCEDTGTYVCEVTNTAGTKTKKFEVTVLEPPVIEPDNSSEELVTRIGGNLSLTCKTRGTPMPDITWLHGGRIIGRMRAKRQISEFSRKMNVTEDGKIRFVISNVTKDSGGTYTVLASNRAGVVEKNFHVSVLSAPKLRRDSHNGETVTVIEAFPILLSCPLDGEPTPSVRWFREGELVVENVDVRISGDQLHIVNSNVSHSGRFRCVAENLVGNATFDFMVKVIGPPKLRRTELSIVAKVNETVTLKCSEVSNETVIFKWLRNSARLSDSNRLFFANNGSKLGITKVALSDSGEYSCIASNIAGSDKVNYVLQVVEPPVLNEESRPNRQKIFQLSHPISLRCPFIGHPEPEIIWHKDGKELDVDHSDERIERVGPLLFISDAISRDSGNYKCFAQNSAGIQEFTFTVDVYVAARWSEWSFWSGCSASCGIGEQTRSRTCGNDLEVSDLRLVVDKSACIGENVEKRKCFNECQIDGGWGSWSEWSFYSATCGRISRKRYRLCNNPIPSNGGKRCNGAEQLEEFMNIECPVNGAWSSWSEWSSCSQSCGGGIKWRQRKCDSPTPRGGGMTCNGPSKDFEACNGHDCGGDWLEWSEWSPCSATCGRGQRKRFRKCDPEGENCEGENLQIEKCLRQKCGTATMPTSAKFRVLGKVNGRPVDQQFSADIEDLGHQRLISANIRDFMNEDSRWFPYPPFLLAPLSWSAAYEKDDADNGYSLTNGNYFSLSDVKFESGEGLTLKHTSEGTDSNGALSIQIEVVGEVPLVEPYASVIVRGVDRDYVQTGTNALYSAVESDVDVNGKKLPFIWNSSISYNNPQRIMPYLVEKLSTKDIRNVYDPKTYNISYTSSSTIERKYEEDKCPRGFIHRPELLHCQDVDECEDSAYLCGNDQHCENTFGSYKCVCNDGFVNAESSMECIDIDECSESPFVCSHFCHNSRGSFSCSCPYGHYLGEDKKMCKELFLEDHGFYREVYGMNSTGMKNYAEFRYGSGEEIMEGADLCPPGFVSSGGRCKDRDECLEEKDLCDEDEICLNILGSYQCLSTPCPEGFLRDFSTRNCVKSCKQRKACKSSSLISETVVFNAVTLTSAYPLKSILQLDVLGREGSAMTTSRFRVTESGDLFRVRESNGRGSLYPLRPLNKDTLYRIKIEARTYDANNTYLYNVEFIVYIIII